MVEPMLAPFLVGVVLSNAAIAAAIGLVAWVGSRLYRRPSLWHAVWVLALVRLFLPPVWSVPAPLLISPTPVASALASPQVTPVDIAKPNATPASHPSSVAAAPAAAPEATPLRRWSLPKVSWSVALIGLWSLGSLAVFSASAFQILRFHALVRRAGPAESATDALVEAAAAGMGETSKRPKVCLVDHAAPPLLWPLGKTPAIVLPARWWRATPEPERGTVVMHELVHWRRGDHWVRLFHWIASVAFWWHPLVWIARGELQRLEEECCDAEVMHRLPGAGRAYASALLSAAQWLDGAPQTLRRRGDTPLLAMRMAHSARFESFHHRIQMLPILNYRPWTRRHLFGVTLAAALPLLVGIGAHADEDDPAPPPPAAQAPVDPAPVDPAAAPTNPTPPTKPTAAAISADHAVLSGSLIDLGKPIPRARVRVVIPSAELRFPLPPGKHREIWGETDEEGAYSIDIPGIDAETTASIDILHPGHRRLVGTLMRGGDKNKVTLAPGKNTEFNAELPQSLYFAGQVVDEQGDPIEGVRVSSMLDTENSTGGVESTLTDAEGRFAIYGYSAEDFQEGPEHVDPTVIASFKHGQYIHAYLESIEKREPSEHDQLRVVMQRGRSIGGAVTAADGAPVPDVAVSIFQAKPHQRRGTRTDQQGKFRFNGVAPSEATLRIVDVSGNRKSIEDLTVAGSNTEMKVTLEPFASPLETTHEVLGMTLSDVTDKIDEAYDLQTMIGKTRGAMVVDPGKRADDFDIGLLRPGYVFWMVGNDRVTDVRSMVSQLVKEAKSPTIPPGAKGNMSAGVLPNGDAQVRVVYTFNDDRGHGTNTAYMKLTKEDIAELDRLRERLGPAEQE